MHTASSDKSPLRLPLVTGRELAGIAIVLMVLLGLVFTSRQQFEQLLEQSLPDALSIAYLESLMRYEEDAKLRLLLASAKADQIDYRELEAILEPVIRDGTAEQRRKVKQIQLRALIAAYNSGRRSMASPDLDVMLYSLASENSSTSDLAFLADSALSLGRSDLAWRVYLKIARDTPEEYRLYVTPAAIHSLALSYHAERSIFSPPDIDVLLHTLATEKSSTADLSVMADSALLLARKDIAWQFYQRIAAQAPQEYRNFVVPAAQRSLGLGYYQLAADLYFLAREGAERSEARRLFASGVGALMASSHYTEAMQEADKHLGDLADDAETLRFLISTARAANNSQRAADYARRLLGAGIRRQDTASRVEGGS